MGFTTSKAAQILVGAIKDTDYVGLFIDGTEVSPNDTGYERAEIGELDSTTYYGQIANKSIIYFPETQDNWGQITHFGLFTDKSGGVPYFMGELSTPVNIVDVDYEAGDTYIPIFRAFALIIALDVDGIETEKYGK